jgi:protein-S-isoprenylcysteine O-methyltransferase Ste14
MNRALVVAYGVASYLACLGAFLYAVGFVENVAVPRSIDSGPRVPTFAAVIVDTLLLLCFAVPHSVMARPAFKRWWTRFVPPPIERSTYVLVSSLALGFLFWQWRSVPAVVWAVTRPLGYWILRGLFWAGWALALVSTFLIDHFNLFGLRQVFLYATGRPYTPVGFRVTGIYGYVRHPIMLGFLVAFWAAPTMTAGHLLFAGATTAYVLIALLFEEHDLMDSLGAQYGAYRDEVGMLLPLRARPSASSPPCS